MNEMTGASYRTLQRRIDALQGERTALVQHGLSTDATKRLALVERRIAAIEKEIKRRAFHKTSKLYLTTRVG